MAREKRIRAYLDEVEVLKEARDDLGMFDGGEPLGKVASILAKEQMVRAHAERHEELDDGR